MDNEKLKDEWKNFTTNDYDIHCSIHMDKKPFETVELVKVFLNHLHRKYKKQVFKALIFVIDHNNYGYRSHAHCLIKCNPNYPKLHELIQLANPKAGIFKELEGKFLAWKFKHNIPKASLKISCSGKVLNELGLDRYKDTCNDCVTKERDLDSLQEYKKNLENKQNKKLKIVNDPCSNCKRKLSRNGWNNKTIIKYVFGYNNFNVNHDHLTNNHLIEFYKWHLEF